MKITIEGVKISGIASIVPEHSFAVADLAKDELQKKRLKRTCRSTGVKIIHTVEGNTTVSDMCSQAARTLLETLGMKGSDVDGIVYSGLSPDYRSPATSIILQDMLGIPQETVAMDICFGCSGYVYGLYQAAMLLRAGGCHKVLLCTGDLQSRMINDGDKSLKVILGDGASATILERGNDVLHFCLKADGSGNKYLIIPAGGMRIPSSEETRKEIMDADGNIRSMENLYMDGMAIMKFSLEEVPKVIDDICQMAGVNKAEIQLYAFHQPNKLILQQLALDMDIEQEKMPICLENTGNTASASIPVALGVMTESGYDFASVKKAVLCGFGIGLSIGAVHADLSQVKILPLQKYKNK